MCEREGEKVAVTFSMVRHKSLAAGGWGGATTILLLLLLLLLRPADVDRRPPRASAVNKRGRTSSRSPSVTLIAGRTSRRDRPRTDTDAQNPRIPLRVPVPGRQSPSFLNHIALQWNYYICFVARQPRAVFIYLARIAQFSPCRRRRYYYTSSINRRRRVSIDFPQNGVRAFFSIPI